MKTQDPHDISIKKQQPGAFSILSRYLRMNRGFESPEHNTDLQLIVAGLNHHVSFSDQKYKKSKWAPKAPAIVKCELGYMQQKGIITCKSKVVGIFDNVIG
uniref:Uncharacterized protein n=1 Tax=Solanum lycopersicum TaxID=4081 RepID=A0A3Q7F6Q7_SOLLC